jgi:pectinesterase
MYLGRPWGPFGRVVFAYTYMDHCIRHVGWNNWGKAENERSACFYEYRYFGLNHHASFDFGRLLFLRFDK